MSMLYPWPRAIFFDLDGTLVDSVPDLADAVDNMLLSLGFAAAGEAKVRLWVGNGAKILVQRALLDATNKPDVEVSMWNDALRIFLQCYKKSSGQKTRLYPYVRDVLAIFFERKIQMAVITNKPSQFTPHLLATLGLADFFELVICGDTLPVQKPDPAPLLFAMQQLQLLPEQCWMVGDSRNDIEAANSAGINSVCVTYGYNHGESPHSLPATKHIAEFSELSGLFGWQR